MSEVNEEDLIIPHHLKTSEEEALVTLPNEKAQKPAYPDRYGVTQEMVTGWKEKYPDSVKKLECPELDAHCYLKVPDRKILSAAMQRSKQDVVAFEEIIMANCFLGGDERFKTKFEFLRGASDAIAELVARKESFLKEV